MAAKFSKTRLGCKIIDIQPDKLHPGRMLVSVQFDDGDPAGPWHQAFSIVPDKVLTMDDFLTHLYKMDIARPVDPYVNLKAAMQEGETFVLKLTAKVESEDHNL